MESPLQDLDQRIENHVGEHVKEGQHYGTCGEMELLEVEEREDGEPCSVVGEDVVADTACEDGVMKVADTGE